MSQPAPASDFPLETIHAAFKQTRMITMSIAASLPVYVLIVEILSRSAATPVPMAASTMMRVSFYVLAGMFIFAATVIKGVLLRNVPPTPEMRLARLRAASIITAAFSEGPAVLGLVLFILTRSRMDFYVLLVVAAYMIVRHLPLVGAWEVYVRRGGDAR